MRKFLLGLTVAFLFAQTSWGACGDTTVLLNGTNPAFNTGTMTFNPATLNTAIDQCGDSTMTITLENASGNSSDTVKFSNELVVSSRPSGAVTHLVGKGRDGGNFIVTETNAADPLMFDIKVNDKAILSSFTLVRKTDNNNNHSVAIASKGSIIRDCHFFRQDNNSLATGSLVSITVDSVLVERCLFRTPPNGKGRAIAISASGNAFKNEYRSNIFYGTGLYLTAGSFHIFANTFAGSREEYNAVVIGKDVLNPNTAVNIQHNLFAFKIDTLPPIYFGGTQTSTDSILKNAFTRSKPTMPLAVNSSGANMTLNNTGLANANVDLRKGFSRYSTHVTEFKEYPLVALRTDENLPRNHADFGKIPRVYNNGVSGWTTMTDISQLASNKLYFSSNGNTFTPFVQGTQWSSGAGVGIKVGALVDLETRITPPSPVDSGAVNKGLVIIRHPSDSTRMRVTNINFTTTWYDTLIPPGDMYFYFSTAQNKLTSNDSTALRTSVGGAQFVLRKPWLNFDSSLVVPKEVRVSGNPIYVKMLHYNGGGQAPVLSAGAIAQVTGLPGFPINDLAVPVVDGSSDTSGGAFVIKVTKVGSEAIDSISVTPQRVGGGSMPAKSAPAVTQGNSVTITFDLPSGFFTFVAAPVAKVGAAFITGSPTAPTRAYSSRQFVGNTVYVTPSTTGCSGKDGKANNPFCTIDAGLTALATNGGGTIILRNAIPAVPFQEATIAGADESPVTIMVDTANNAFSPANRLVFRGSATKEAIALSRKNITLKGLTIEMPAGSTAPAVTLGAAATGATVDGCLFRPTSAGAAGGPAVLIETGGNGEARVVSNVIWGFTSGVRINSVSSAVRILHNTFIEEPSVNTTPATGISVPAAASTAVVANNYFSGVSTAFATDAAGKALKLDHNSYTVAQPALQGLSELGGLDMVPRLVTPLDLTAASWAQDLKLAMETITDCSAVKSCNTLYAGSSNDPYGPALLTDVLGKPRLGKPEVGAFEAEASPNFVRGVVTVAVGSYPPGTQGSESRLPFTVTRKTLDTADVDSLHVWWSTEPSVDLDDKVLRANQRHYGLKDLAAGTVADTALGLLSNKNYNVFAALGKTRGVTRTLGYAYRAAGLTQPGVTKDDCKYGMGNSNCPTNVEFFTVADGEAAGQFFTKVKFALPDTGIVRVPQFTFGNSREYGKISISSPFPQITLDLSADLTKQAGSNQSWTANIRCAADPTALLAEKELFIIPTEASGLPTYVPTWRLRKEGADVWLDIEGTQSGAFTYGFGNVKAGAPTGSVTLSTPVDAPPRFSFKTTGDVDTLSLTLKGSGFATTNPLIVVTPMAAGGTVPNAFDGKFPNKSLLITAGYASLSDTLKKDRFSRYFEQAVQADGPTQSPAPAGTNKPFLLTSMADAGTFKDVAILDAPSLVVKSSGESDEITVKLPVFPKYAEGDKYPDNRSRITRSIELMFSIFDGDRVYRTSSFVRTEFADNSAHPVHFSEKFEFDNNAWNLFSYPWDEADTGSLARVLKATTWSKSEHLLYKYKGAGNGPAAYIQYDGTNAAGITYDQGQAAWSGSSKFYEPFCYGGISLDYKPFEMPLPAGAYTDFGLPFNFTMKWADILSASGKDVTSFKAWRFSPKTQKSQAGWDALDVRSVVHPWQGLTAKPTEAVTLKFPIVDSSRSSTSLAKVGSGELWSAKVRAFDGTAYMNLRIGKAAREDVTGEAPMIPGQDFRFNLVRQVPEGRQTLSEHIQSGEDWRGHWAVGGNAPQDGIRLAVVENLKETPLYLVETLDRRAIPLVPGTETGLSKEDLASGDWHLVAGDARYLEEVLDGLVPLHMLALSNYPNPFSGATLIRYALPEGFGRVEFRMKIRDSRGRMVWEGVQKGSGSSLRHTWDGRDKSGKAAPAGFYTLTLEALAPGKATQRAVRRLLKM